MKLRQTLFFALVGLLSSFSLKGQEAQFTFLAESYNGEVKLGWLPKEWPAGLDGLVIRRSTDQETWVQLNQVPIVPGFYLDKPLDNIEPDATERQRLKDKQTQLLNDGKAREKSTEFYRSEILPNARNLRMLAFAFSTDYDIMRLNGFGFVDRAAPEVEQVFYGLFAVENGQVSNGPIETVEVNPTPGKNPGLAMKTSIEATAKKDKVLLKWQYLIADFKKAGFKAFNVYKIENDGQQKINENPIIVASSGDSAVLNREVVLTQGDDAVVYEARPLSQFDFEMEGAQIEVHPTRIFGDVGSPTLRSIVIDKGIMLVWEGLRRGYKIELQRKDAVSDFKKLVVLNSEAVSYRDLAVDKGQVYAYRLIVHMTHKRPDIYSNEIQVKFQKNAKPGKVRRLTAELVTTESGTEILLKWSSVGEGVVYRVFTDSPFGALAHDSSIPDLQDTSISIAVSKSRSEVRHFAIQAMNSDRKKGDLSKTVEVITPSSKLPPLRIWPIQTVGQDVVLYWDYTNEIPDLQNFNLYQNGQLLVLNEEIGSAARNIRIRDVEDGDHSFELEAVTRFGVKTRSQPIRVLVGE